MKQIDSFLVNLIQKELRPEYGIICRDSITDNLNSTTTVYLEMGNESFSIEYSTVGDVYGNIRFACREFIRVNKPYEFAMNQIREKGINETNLIDLYFILKNIYEPRTIPGSRKDDGDTQTVEMMETTQ